MAEVMEKQDVMDMMEELPFPADNPVQGAVAEAVTESAKEERKEISIQFAKGLCGEPFTAKDGKEYVQIKIPGEEKKIWPTFVLPAKQVHENEYGKGLWARIPEEGTTTIRHTQVVGEDENGKKLYDHQNEKVPNKTLKAMIEAYKEKSREAEPKPSITEQLKEPMVKVLPASQSVRPPVTEAAR